MIKKVRKAVIPAAGFGTRFLPATKSIPKEMFPIIDKPVIHYAVEEAIKAGITEIVFITGRGKRAIEDYFDHAYELEDQLKKSGKNELLKQVEGISDLANISYIRQKEPLGLGHAVLRAKELIGDEPFAIILPDMLVDSDVPYMKQVMDAYEKTGKSVIGFKETTRDKVSLYGIADPAEEGDLFKLRGVVEKPSPEEAPSNLYIFGRYIMTPEIFKYLEQTKPGKNGEIQLTDAIQQIIKTDGAYGVKLIGEDYDTGEKIGFVKATIAFAMKNERFSVELTEFFKSLKEN